MWILNFCCRDRPPSIKRQMVPVLRTETPLKKSMAAQYQQVEVSSSKPGLALQSSRVMKNDRYQGEDLNGVPHGNGYMLYANGDFYRGEWVSGKKQGRGLQVYQELGMQYEGEWQNDKFCGQGKLIEQNSSHYTGDFKNGVKHGKGQYYDFEKKKFYNQFHQYGSLKQHIQLPPSKSHEEEFPTLALDKQRFNTEDLKEFEEKNPRIKQFDLFFLLKYYGLCRLSKLQCVSKTMKDWTIKEVIDCLDSVQLKVYKQSFYKNKIKGKDLMSLSEKEMKDDLKMNMGDRKRFLNYILFLNELEHNAGEGRVQRKSSKQRLSYKLNSATKMRKLLKNVKNYPVFEESIKEENSQSENQGQQQFHSTHKLAIEGIDHSSQERVCKRQYDSAAIQLHSLSKKLNEENYLQDVLQPKSERSSSKRDVNRKDSKQMGESNNNHYNNSVHKSSSMINRLGEKQSDNNLHRLSEVDNYAKEVENAKEENKSSSTSSDGSEIELVRKKTQDKSHNSSQIRELYEFLKIHRSLDFLIKEKDIQKLQQIGQGGYGKVYKGMYVGMQIAIKDYMKTRKHHHKEDFMKEVQIISDLKHPNIVLYMGMCITANKYTLITEYLQNGSLFDQLHVKKKKFSSMEKIEISFDIAKGMVYLHNMKKILHRDLKSSNVLIGEDWQVKLCDFGLSAQKKKQKKYKNRIGTYQWMAPEVIRNEEKIDEFADVYSFGVITWELLSEKIPYEGLSEQQVIGLVGYDNDHHFEQPPGPPFLLQIMHKCLKKIPAQRPTFIAIQSEFEEHLSSEKDKNAN